MSTFGTHIQISLFGESHGPHVGITIHHLPANHAIDLDHIKTALNRRRPDPTIGTSRREPDTFKIISGLFNGKTTGMPLTVLIDNVDVQSEAYQAGIVRPSHADLTAYTKYGGANDYRGGGHFSGRLSAPLVVLGEIARQMLYARGISVISHIQAIEQEKAPSYYTQKQKEDDLKSLINSPFPVLNPDDEFRFKAVIKRAKDAQDSVGGIVETIVYNPPKNLGEPFFDRFQSVLSHLIMSIPGVRGIEIGRGFESTQLSGSIHNDPLDYENDTVKYLKNDAGGLSGGITTGEPIVFKTAIKPTPSIQQPQQTVNINTKKAITHTIQGRHDACIVPRALHVITALTYYTILELLLRSGKSL